MQCDDVGPLILRRLEGRLEADEGQRLERHLEQGEACRETLDAQRRVAAVLSSRPGGEAPQGLQAPRMGPNPRMIPFGFSRWGPVIDRELQPGQEDAQAGTKPARDTRRSPR